MKTLEELLEQHSHYDLGDGFALTRRYPEKWCIYLWGVELAFAADKTSEVRHHKSVREAKLFLLTQSGVSMTDAARKNLTEQGRAPVEVPA